MCSIIAPFFPRCSKFSILSRHDAIKCYRAYYDYCCLYFIDKPARQADDFCERLKWCYTPRTSREVSFFNLMEFILGDRLGLIYSKNSDDRKKIWNTVYNVFRVSRHFLSFVCNWNTDYCYSEKMYDVICSFYSHRELYRLKVFYQSQCDYLERYTVDDLGYRAFYNNSEKLSDSYLKYPVKTVLNMNSYYTSNIVDSYVIASNRVKHKRLNDKNNLLLIS